jgi:hypothetical protein
MLSTSVNALQDGTSDKASIFSQKLADHLPK